MRSTSIPGTLFPQKKLSITDLRLIFLLHWSRLPSGQCWFRSEVACNEGNIQAFHRRNFWQHRRHLVVDEVKSRPIPASQGVLSAAKRWNFASCATVAGKAVLILEWIGLRENLHWKLSFSRLTPKYMSCIFPSFNSWNYVDIENDMTMAKPNENLTT